MATAKMKQAAKATLGAYDRLIAEPGRHVGEWEIYGGNDCHLCKAAGDDDCRNCPLGPVFVGCETQTQQILQEVLDDALVYREPPPKILRMVVTAARNRRRWLVKKFEKAGVM